MVLVMFAALGVVVGLVLGGDLGRLADLRLRGLALFAAALGLQFAAYPTGLLPWHVSDDVATGLWLASYVLLIAIALLNRRVRGFGIAALGMASNLAAVIANGGHMPALPAAMRAAGVAYVKVHNNSVASDHPHLAWLVDRWGAPGWLPAANVYSVGDLLLAVGATVIVSAAMGPRWLPRLRRTSAETG